MDKTAQIVIPAKHQYLGPFHDGLALFRNGSGDVFTRFGFLDRCGEEAIPAVFHSARGFSDAARVGSLWGYIEPSGIFKITPRFEARRIEPRRPEDTEIGSFNQGLAYVREGNGYGFVDKTGNFVTRDDFDEADGFREGRERVRLKQQKRCGYIDPSGAVVIEPRFASASCTSRRGWPQLKKGKTGPTFQKVRPPSNSIRWSRGLYRFGWKYGH